VVSNHLFTVLPEERASNTARSHFLFGNYLMFRTFRVAQLCSSTLVLVRRGQNWDISNNLDLCLGDEAQSTRRVYGVVRHVLANGSASFQSHPNHSNTIRPNPADRAIQHTKDLRAETGSFGAFKPNTFTFARFVFVSRARERVWKGMCQLRLLAFAGMIGREGSSRLHHSVQEMGDPSVLERSLRRQL